MLWCCLLKYLLHTGLPGRFKSTRRVCLPFNHEKCLLFQAPTFTGQNPCKNGNHGVHPCPLTYHVLACLLHTSVAVLREKSFEGMYSSSRQCFVQREKRGLVLLKLTRQYRFFLPTGGIVSFNFINQESLKKKSFRQCPDNAPTMP